MIKLGFKLSTQNNCLEFKERQKISVQKNDLQYHVWEPSSVVLFTIPEVQELHCYFGHPSVGALYNLLRKVRREDVDSRTMAQIDNLAKIVLCVLETQWTRKGSSWQLELKNCVYTNRIADDILFIEGSPVLHVIDEATHVSAARFLRDIFSASKIKTLCNCWMQTWMGPPDFLHVDQCSNFDLKKSQASLTALDMTSIHAPIESPNPLSHVTR